MRDPEIFKYDVRVRDRLLKLQRVSASEIEQMFTSLPDLDGTTEPIELEQPALYGDAARRAAIAAANAVAVEAVEASTEGEA